MNTGTTTIDLARFKQAVGFVPQFTCKFGNVRKANIDKVALDTAATPDADADQRAEKKAKKVMQLKKQLLISKEYDAIKSFYGELRTWIYANSVPSFFREGFQLASLEAVAPIEARMKKAVQQELPDLVKAFVAAYPAQVEESRLTLEPVGQWNALDYPPAAQLPQMFAIGWNWISFVAAEGLPAELRAVEQAKLEKQMTDAGEQITQALRAGFSELIAHAQTKLSGTDPKTGKAQIFRDSLIGNVMDFCETFSRRNITNDVELQQLVNKAKEVLTGVTPQKLRDQQLTRDTTAKQFEEIKNQLDGMIVSKPARAINLDDEV